MSIDQERVRARVIELEIEHRDLDDAIDRLHGAPDRDELLHTCEFAPGAAVVLIDCTVRWDQSTGV